MAEIRTAALPGGEGRKALTIDEAPKPKIAELDHADVLKRYHRAFERERENMDAAYSDLEFYSGMQWPEELRIQRENDSRPVLTFNRLGQYVRQITGDMRQMKPAIKVMPVDSRADEKLAEIRSGMIRYIENRSDAEKAIYPGGADSQVQCGIGHWEIYSEYAEDTTFEQELGLRLVDDQVSVIWDPDAKHPVRKDAAFCFCPVTLTRDAYEETYPDKPVSEIGFDSLYREEWYRENAIRVARYWYKVKMKRKLFALPGGGYEDVTDEAQELIARAQAAGAEIVEREGFKIRFVMMNGTEFLTEPQDWPGRYIPIVPVIGEEIRVGSRCIRHGVVRFAADAQRAYNYARSTQTEFVGLAPKSPFIGTEENFKDYENEWNTANVKNWPFLRYKPDPRNGSAPPQRQLPPSTAPGLTECVTMAEHDMQAVIGIYNAQLGARSNETSGIAIARRERQGDIGTFVYMDNFALSITHTARILNDLIPHFYDTARTVRIIGVDGTEKRVDINQPEGVVLDDTPYQIANDVTSGAYDIVMDMGPSYATKREEAREGMTAFIQAFPPAGPLIADLVAKAQDWPNADEVSDRLFHILPPPLQAQIAEKSGDPDKQPPQPPPDPLQQAMAEAEMAKASAEKAKAEASIRLEELKLQEQQLNNVKAEFGVLDAQMRLAANGMPVDPAWFEQVDLALDVLNEATAAQLGIDASPQESSAGLETGNMEEIPGLPIEGQPGDVSAGPAPGIDEGLAPPPV